MKEITIYQIAKINFILTQMRFRDELKYLVEETLNQRRKDVAGERSQIAYHAETITIDD